MKSVSLYRVNAVILLAILSVVALYYFQPFLIPLFFSIILSMLLLPVADKLESWGIGRVWSTFICILLFMLVVAAVIWVLAAQGASLSEDLPQIEAKLMLYVSKIQQWIEEKFGVAPQQQVEFVQEQISQLSSSANQFFTSFLGGTFGLLADFVLVVLYTFFLMWRRERYVNFLLKLVSDESRTEAKETLHQITKVSAQYLAGRFISMVFLIVFYSIGLSAVGLKNAILVSIIAVLPTLIPYIGAYIGAIFPLMMTLISGETGTLLPTIIILIIAQVIDNNLIEPFAMGTSLNLNPLFTIVAIVLGELLWGIPGMILFEPMFAIMRIVSQHIPALDPYAYLLEGGGKDTKWSEKISHMIKQLFRKK